MPPRATISREQVEAAAFEITRAEGLEALTVRRIASELGCSTQPVYTACSSMEVVTQAVRARALQTARTYSGAEHADVPPLLRLGYGMLTFANQEPQLFRLVSDALRNELDCAPPVHVLTAMRADPQMRALPDASLARIHTLLWIFSLGLTALVPPQAPAGSLERARGYLRDAGRAIIEHELRRAAGE